nr:hypothetical protein [Tanacetum cinerariifolium]
EIRLGTKFKTFGALNQIPGSRGDKCESHVMAKTI